MNSKLVILVVFSLATLAFADIWSDCGTSSDHLNITSITITPDPPVKGQNVTVVAVGSLDETVTGGSISVDVHYSKVPIFSHTYNLCDQTYLPCPISPGTVSRTITESIPKSAPSGTYSATVKVLDQNQQEITCISAVVNL